jgi:hypothetical protein
MPLHGTFETFPYAINLLTERPLLSFTFLPPILLMSARAILLHYVTTFELGDWRP